ncbi:helix-turn-helix domain-containing protein [Candidatus Chloroploca sp. M-50]|uniref:Helix-turn-helix domain-containing protein n=1 Tax=Candidatus Chloroploca mongolica TaxID=2528176 RepID=A0ABS4D9Q3_9CHLR|nr:helix-turn-helix domain-containing protein [Candidatus Chloroploca mongolica]MBP1466176.1 helix-turn-helix domain-containing protein [Candidatus Chloroploca mongolica]
MRNRSETFGRLLKGAINSIATYEGKTAPIIEEELAEQVGLAGSAIQRYKAGSLPPDPRTIEIIAEAAVRRGLFSREWLQRFLHAARYHQADQLLDRLCPLGPARPRPPRVYQNLPAPTYSQFVMRAEAFAEVLDGLSKRSAAVIIVGLGGNGKTSLAREVADACLKDENSPARFDAAVWVSDKDRPGTTNLSIVLDEIARTLDYPGFTQFEHDEKRREVEQLLRRQRVLVCLDNVETITDGALLSWLLNLPEPSKTLITTREYRREYRRGGWPVELRGMSDSEAWQLIHERACLLKIDQLIGAPDQVEPLLAATGGNPKALTITLGLLKYERRPLQQVVDDLYAARGELFADLFDRAWSLLDEAARRVLLVATFFPTNASAEALSASADVQGFAFDRAVERLADLALLDVQQDDLNHPPRYTIHPLVHAFAMAHLADQPLFERDARERWVSWCVTLALQVGHCPHEVEKLSLLDLEHETTFWAMKWAYHNRCYEDVLQLGHGSMYYYYVKGLWDKWFDANLMRLEAVRKIENFIEEVRALAYQVQMLSRQGKISEATEFRQALEHRIHNRPLSGDTFFLVHHCLGAYALAIDDVKAAEMSWRRILAEPEQLSHYRSVTSRQWVGLCLYYQGQKQAARALFQEALHEAVVHNYGRYMLFNQIRLAALELDEENIDRAEQALEQSVRLARHYHDREQLAYALRLTSRLCAMQENTHAAKAALAEAIDLFERIGLRRDLAEAREELRRLDEMGDAPAV